MPIVRRRQKPPDFENYTDFKPFLRIDFRWRCGYCGIHEINWGGSTHFHVEHFRPKSLWPELVNSYVNMYYCCDVCNRYKAAKWPSTALQGRGYRFYDPCADFASQHFRDDGSGRLLSLTPCGEYSISVIRLDREQLRRIRQERRELNQKYREGLRQLRVLRADLSTAEEPRRAVVAALVSTLEFCLAQIRGKYFRPANPP